MARVIPEEVPPVTSTLLIVVIPLSPWRPLREVDTLNLIGSSVSWPMLMFAMARDWPIRRNPASLEVVSSSSKESVSIERFYCPDDVLKDENAEC